MNPVMSEKRFRLINGINRVLVSAIVTLLLCAHFGSSIIPTESMIPTIKIGSLVLYAHVNGEDLRYGDIVIFMPDADENVSFPTFFHAFLYHKMGGGDPYTKRVVGLAGDVIEVHDGYLWRNGVKQIEEYVAEDTSGEFAPYTVPDGHVFCMGDNRNHSLDSRYFGAFPENAFYGRAWAILPPIFS